jgi:cell division protein FtsI/penicillin-binding protein 2
METKGRNVHMHHYRNRLKWKIRNNYVFFIIIAIICVIMALVFTFKVYNFERDKSMEVLLDKSRRQMHWGGITDRDVETLRKTYPNFNWEKAWDRTRWLSAEKQKQERRSREKARQSYQLKKK